MGEKREGNAREKERRIYCTNLAIFHLKMSNFLRGNVSTNNLCACKRSSQVKVESVVFGGDVCRVKWRKRGREKKRDRHTYRKREKTLHNIYESKSSKIRSHLFIDLLFYLQISFWRFASFKYSWKFPSP